MTATAAVSTSTGPTGRRLEYALVTPARDEESNLRRLAASLLGQTITPGAWIVVDDGSTDGTAALVEGLAEEHDWISVIAAPVDGGGLVEGRLMGRDVAAFQAGLAALPERPDVVLSSTPTSPCCPTSSSTCWPPSTPTRSSASPAARASSSRTAPGANVG